MVLSSLALRIISSAVLIPIVIGIIWFGGWVFAGFATICIAIALYEWINISRHIDISRHKKIILCIAGALYLGFSLFEIIYLRSIENGFLYTLIFMVCIWASDSGAYLLGKTIGGPKMSPTISPNKTWAGYIGALLGPAIFINLVIFPSLGSYYTLALSLTPIYALSALTIGIAGQSGDLMVSAMKRKAGLKDTGALIPGHGGILDRIDALLLALPVYIAVIKFIEWYTLYNFEHAAS